MIPSCKNRITNRDRNQRVQYEKRREYSENYSDRASRGRRTALPCVYLFCYVFPTKCIQRPPIKRSTQSTSKEAAREKEGKERPW